MTRSQKERTPFKVIYKSHPTKARTSERWIYFQLKANGGCDSIILQFVARKPYLRWSLPFCIEFFLCLSKKSFNCRKNKIRQQKHKLSRFFSRVSVITDAPANIIIPFSGSPFFAGALPMTQRATNNTNYFDSLRVAKNNDSQPKKFCLKNSRSSSVFLSWYQRNRQGPGAEERPVTFTKQRVFIGRQ